MESDPSKSNPFGRALLLIVLASLLSGASPGSVPPPAPATPAQIPSAASSTSTPIPSPEPEAPPLETIKHRARVERLSAQLERLRGRPFKQPVEFATESREQYRTRLLADVHAHQSPNDIERLTAGYVAMGLIPHGYNIVEGEVELAANQVAASYNAQSKRFRVITSNQREEVLDALVFHELVHVLQDQYLDLESLSAQASRSGSPDAYRALRYWIEGEATYLTFCHQLEAQGLPLEIVDRSSLDTTLLSIRNRERADVENELKRQYEFLPEAERVRALNSLKSVPSVLFWQLYGPYQEGLYAMHRRFEQGGWSAIDQLYRDLPQSTEQVLHPEKGVSPRDEPAVLTIPDFQAKLGPDWTLVYASMLGEAGIRAFFDTYQPKEKRQIAAGWDGDHFALYRSKTGEQLLIWWTVWDNSTESGEFERALEAVPFETFVRGAGKVTRVAQPDGIRFALFVGSPAAVDMASALGKGMQSGG